MAPRSTKLPAEERKQAILAAAAPVFARLGQTGATTKEIARAAGISEALLYKHFRDKEALYAELENHCVEAHTASDHLFADATPSTEMLVMGVAVLVQAVFLGIGGTNSHEDTKRLVTASLLTDGHFAKAFLDRHVKPSIDFFEESLQAARMAGDIEVDIPTGRAELWFVHHLANTLHLISLPGSCVVDYGMTTDELNEKAIRFLLRGLGLKNSAIEQYCNPKELKTMLRRLVRE